MSKFKGVFTALVTPFWENQSLDRDTFVDLIERQIKSGINGIVPCGTTGESPTLSEEEHLEVVKIAVETAKGRCKVVAGTGANCTKEAIIRTKEAEKLGVDGTLQVVPYYNKPSQEGIYQHFKAISESVPNLPIMLYNVPGRTGVNMFPETTLRLAEIPNIVAIKEASGDLEQVREICNKKPDDFTVLSGDDALAYDFAQVGAEGLVSVASNLFPAELTEMMNFLNNKQFNEAEKIHKKYVDFFGACFLAGNPASIKYIMFLKRLCKPVLRLPLYSPEQEKQEEIKKILEKL